MGAIWLFDKIKRCAAFFHHPCLQSILKSHIPSINSISRDGPAIQDNRVDLTVAAIACAAATQAICYGLAGPGYGWPLERTTREPTVIGRQNCETGVDPKNKHDNYNPVIMHISRADALSSLAATRMNR